MACLPIDSFIAKKHSNSNYQLARVKFKDQIQPIALFNLNLLSILLKQHIAQYYPPFSRFYYSL